MTLDTGHRIGAAADTAAFIRAQMARGVSAETLRRRLNIKPESMDHLIVAAGCLPATQEPPKPRQAPVVQGQPPPIDVAPAASAIAHGAILRAVCDAWEVTPAEILETACRPQRVVRPRQALYLLLQRHLNLSLWGVSRVVGLKSHCSVMRGVSRAAGLYKLDADWRRRFDLVEAALKARAA